MSGFVFGLAIFVTVSQLPKLFGLEKGPGDTVQQFVHLVANLGQTSWVTLVVGVVALALLFGLERIPRIPGGLVVLVLAILASTVFQLGHHGVKTVGEIPAGLPSVKAIRISASDVAVLLPSALGIMLVIFSEALGAGQTFADKHGYRLDPSQDMIAIGLANVASGFLGGLACGGSLSQTAVNDQAGARTELSAIVAAALSLITVVALTPLFTNLPEAVLAAMVIHAVSHLMKVGEMRRFYELMPREFWLGAITLLGVIVLDVLPGLIIGVSFSILLLVYRASRPRFSVMGTDRDAPRVFEDVGRHPSAEAIAGILIIRPDAPLFYANAQVIRDTVEEMVAAAKEPVDAVVIDPDANDDIDVTSIEALEKLAAGLRGHNVRIALAHVHEPVKVTLGRAQSLGGTEIGPMFPDLASARAWAGSAPT